MHQAALSRRSYLLETVAIISVTVILLQVGMMWMRDEWRHAGAQPSGISLMPAAFQNAGEKKTGILTAAVSHSIIGKREAGDARTQVMSTQAMLAGDVFSINGMDAAELRRGVFLFVNVRADGSLKVDKALISSATSTPN